MIFAHRPEAPSKNCSAETSALDRQRLQIAFRRTANHGFRIRLNHEAGPCAKQFSKFEGLECANNSKNAGGAQRQIVGIAVHEADPAPVHAHLRQVAREQRSRAFAPMQYLISSEVSTDPNQSEPAAERVRFTMPKPETCIRALDPLPV